MADMSDVQGNGDIAKVTGRFRPFLQRSTSRYKVPTTASAFGEKRVGSNSNLAALSGSMHNLTDPAKLMSLQDDARSRKISSEVMKHCLYKGVSAPCRRRIANRMSYSSSTSAYNSTSYNSTSGNSFYSRKMLSLPVTPMQSVRVTPNGSPTEDRRFFYGFLSHGPTPRSSSPVQMADFDQEEINPDEDDGERDCKGLASLFKPQPRQVMARVWSQQNIDDEFMESQDEGRNESQTSTETLKNLSRYRSPNSIIKRKTTKPSPI